MSLQIHNIAYEIAKKPILQDISFEVEKGEVAAIVGANGAGKSTLLRLIAGDHAPSKGNIHFSGKEIIRISTPELAKNRAVLAQQTRVNMDFTVQEITLMGRYPHFNGTPTKNDFEKVELSMEITGIQPFAKRSYTHLSGGEQQRVNVSRAMAQVWEGMENQEGKLLLLDEPLNNLDIEHQHQTLEIAQEFAENGNTVMVVLHDLNMAARFADKLVMLADGQLFAVGTPKEVLTSETIRKVFRYPAEVAKHPFLDCPMVYYGCCPSNFSNGQKCRRKMGENAKIEEFK